MPPHRLSPPLATAAQPAASRRSRGPEFSLSAALRSPAFTPRRQDTAALIELFLDGEVAESAVAQALQRVGPPAFSDLLERLEGAKVRGAARAALVRLLGRLTRPEEPAELAALLARTRDSDPPAARNAIASLGRLPLAPEAASGIEAALLALWPERPRPEDRRALAEALGKLGGEAALAVLRAALPAAAEPLLEQVLTRAVLRLTRTTLRPEPSGAARLDAAAALPRPTAVTLLCRAGLTPILAQELRDRGLCPPHPPLAIEEPGRLGEPGRVTLRSARPLAELLAARTCTGLALPLAAPSPLPTGAERHSARPSRPLRAPAAEHVVPHLAEPGREPVIAQVAAALCRAETVQLMRALDRGPLRYRVHFTAQGHRRALVWRIAAEVARRCPELRNDPTDSPWELRIGGEPADPAAPPRLELVPRQLPDPRFAYRIGDVPAASHPTLAAALARLGAAGPGDVVWDPFVGSGSELIEVALLAPGRGARMRLFGSDLSAAALDQAAANAAAAGVELTLTLAEALGPPPPGLTRIITNPPMGRRVRRGEVTELLHRFAAHAARVLPPGGQLTWIAPQPQRTSPILKAGGLARVREHQIDMNGFWARLEVWVKP